MPEPLFINEAITIPAHELTWTAIRGSGPGGQNVNKVASKVELRFALKYSHALSPSVKARLRPRATRTGDIIVIGAEHRDQPRNLDDARERLRKMILAALVEPKKRKKTKPSRGAKERRLKDKRAASEKKAARRRGD